MTNSHDPLREQIEEIIEQSKDETGDFWYGKNHKKKRNVDAILDLIQSRSRTDQIALLERLESHVNHMKGFSDMPGFIDEELTRLEGEGK